LIHLRDSRMSRPKTRGRVSSGDVKLRVSFPPPYLRMPREPQDGISVGLPSRRGAGIPLVGHGAREVKEDALSLEAVCSRDVVLVRSSGHDRVVWTAAAVSRQVSAVPLWLDLAAASVWVKVCEGSAVFCLVEHAEFGQYL
jgi:hypothetical protein